MDTSKNCHSYWASIMPVVAFVYLSLSSFLSTAQAQVSTRISSVGPTEIVQSTPLTIQAQLLGAESIANIFFLYRPFAVNEWTRLEMDVVGNTATANIPARDVLSPFVEYYIVLVDRAGALETYPLSESADPFNTPPGKTLQIRVQAKGGAETNVMFLSPEPFSTVVPEEFLISVSLFRVDTVVDKRATQLFLDAKDITAEAVFSGDIIVYAPGDGLASLVPGTHSVTVRLFDREAELHGETGITFTVPISEELDHPARPPFTYRVGMQLESRNESINDAAMWYNRGNVQFSGKQGDWRFLSRIFLTSDEKNDRQPQNRYSLGIESPWIKATYGDAYPSFPDLVLSGKRVRGLTSSLKLDFLNVDLTLGKTTRDVEGTLLKLIRADTLYREQERDPISAYGKIDDQTWGKFSYGTFARNLFAIRPSFGSGRTWELGFTWLKSKDDVGSIRYGTRPQENFVVGSDFFARFDDNRIEIGGQGAFSAFNSDISGGSFTDERIDSLFKDEQKRKDARDVRNFLQNIITVNENLTPLSFKKLSTIAYESFLGLNYLDQAVRLTYIYRGNNYHSFGQTFLRKDVQGFNVVDRLRFINNLMFATVGYERLKDNTSDTKVATTTYSNFNIALGYSPVSSAQTFTVGYARFANSNTLPLDSLAAVDDETNRFFVQSTFDFDAGARHTLSVNVSASDRDDKSQRKIDVKSTTIAMGVGSQYSIPLRTSVDMAINLNKFPGGTSGTQQELNYTSLSLNGRYSVQKETVIFMATLTPTFGGFRRTVVDLGTQWYVMPSMSFILQFTYFNNPGPFNDTIWSLRYQYDL